MEWENRTLIEEFFSEGAFWLPKTWASLFRTHLNDVCSHPGGQWHSYYPQHFWLPPSHPDVLLPGKSVLLGHLLHDLLYSLHPGTLSLRKKDHFTPWLRSADVSWFSHGDNRVCAPGYDGFWSLCGHLQPFEVPYHHEQEFLCDHGNWVLVFRGCQLRSTNRVCDATAFLWKCHQSLSLWNSGCHEDGLYWHLGQWIPHGRGHSFVHFDATLPHCRLVLVNHF